MYQQAERMQRRPTALRQRKRLKEYALDRSISQRDRLDRIGWSLAYVGLLGYTLAIVTYTLPIGEISMIAALVGLFFMRGVKLPLFLLLFGGLILWSIVGYTSTPYPATVYGALDRAIRIWLIAFVAVNAIRTPAQLRFYLVFFLGLFALYPARGAIFNYVGGYTVWGRALWNHIFENPNDLAALTFLPLSIAAALFMTERSRLFRWGALASLAVLPVLILLTQSRGAFIALLVVGLLVLALKRERGRILAAMVGLAVVVAFVVPSSAWTRFSGLSSLTSTETIAEADPEGSAEARFHIWQTAGLIIRDYPITGVGLGAYSDAHERYAVLVPGAPQGRMDAHSTYLWILATTGVPGFLLFVLILASCFVRAERVRTRIQKAAPRFSALILYLELGLLAYLVAGIFGSFVLLAFLYLQLALIWTSAEVGEREHWRLIELQRTRQNTRVAR